MLVDSRRYRASRVATREQITLLLSGVCLALLLTVFSSIYIGHQGMWYRLVHHKTVVNDPLVAFRDFIAAIDAESHSRVRSLVDIGSRMQATDRALAAFTTDLQKDSSIPVVELQHLFASYRAAGVGHDNMGATLTLHLSVLEEASGLLLALIHDTLSPRPKSAVSTLVTLATVAAYSSMASRAQFLHGSHEHLPPGEREYILPAQATALAVQVAIATSFGRLASEIDPHSVANEETALMSDLLAPSVDILENTFGFAVPTTGPKEVAMPTALDSLAGLEQFLESRDDTAGASVSNDLRSLLLLAVGAVLSLIACVAAACILVWHAHTTSPARRLAAAFENTAARRRRRLQYMPLLQDLRAVALPRGEAAAHVTEVEREYLVAARAVDAVRVAVPQLLMTSSALSTVPATSLAAHGGGGGGSTAGEGGDADPGGGGACGHESSNTDRRATEVSGARFPLLSQSPRLELGSILCRGAVVMEFSVFLSDETVEHTAESLAQLHRVLSCLFHVIVEEVNLSGGVVLGFHEGVHVLCAWNVDCSGALLATDAEAARAGETVAAAIRVSWIVRHRLQHEECILALNPATRRASSAKGASEAVTAGTAPTAPARPVAHLCASIVSGQLLVANEAILGDRCDVMLEGSVLSNLSRMRLVARTALTSTLLDGTSQRRMPSTWQRHCCKPLVVLRGGDGVGAFTLYSASDEDGTMSSDQAVLYSAGFVLYQNNMIKEAVNEFKRYLALYPDDCRAVWLMNHVLLPKQCSLETNA